MTSTTTTTTTTTGATSSADATGGSINNIQQVHSSIPYYLRPNDLQKKLNALMVELLPELDTPDAQTPMANGKWKSPQDQLDSSEGGLPCFIPTNNVTHPPPIKPGYIWMPKHKDLPEGYYHVRTQEAYIRIYQLFRTDKRLKPKPTRMLFGSNQFHRKSHQEYNDLLRQLKDLMFNRLITDVPNDAHAARMKLYYAKAGGDAKTRFGKAAYLPTLSVIVLSSLTH